MLQSVNPAASYSLRTRLSRPELQAAKGRRAIQQQNNDSTTAQESLHDNNNDSNNQHPSMSDADGRNQELGSDDEDGGGKGGKGKSRRELPAGAVQTLKAWLLSPEHFTHPYPTPQDQAMLMQKTGIDKKQLKNWFTNARRRIWKPMLKKQIEQGKLTTTGVAGGVAVAGGLMVPAMPGSVTAAGAPMDNPHSVQAMRAHYQQAVQGQPQHQQQVTVDAYGNQVYVQPQPPPLQGQQHQHHQQQQAHQQNIDQSQQYYLPVADPGGLGGGSVSPMAGMHQSSSIGSLPPMMGSGSTGQLNKTDSHAVLMELFARDQDLVRQATESARMKAAAKKQDGQPLQQQPPLLSSVQASQPQQSQQQQSQQQGGSSQHPMKSGSQPRLTTVPSLNSWPHFSSISSLNNLGSMPGVKSITSMSGVDLANQGNVNKMGNLAQVKSMESMGKNDSYAFLEVFFGDRSLGSMNNLGGRGGQGPESRGKREREEDNDVGLSLDDEGPTTNNSSSSIKQESGPQPDPLNGGSPGGKDGNDSGTLKRAYDDALAARGLMSVSRSSEKLTDLPAKMQRSLSQEYIHQNSGSPPPESYGQFSFTPVPAPADQSSNNSGGSGNQQHHQYGGQHSGEPVQQSDSHNSRKESNNSVQVPAATKCALCNQGNVDTQLRPCGHLFHEGCLKPTLQAHVGHPKCPVDHIAMQSALLAVPTDDPQISSSKPWGASTSSNNHGVLASDSQGSSGQ